MARNQSQGGSRGKRGAADKPAGRQRSATEKKVGQQTPLGVARADENKGTVAATAGNAPDGGDPQRTDPVRAAGRDADPDRGMRQPGADTDRDDTGRGEISTGGTRANEDVLAGRTVQAKGPDTGPVGSDPDAAKSFGGRNDFGASVHDTTERDYVSANTKSSDPGHAQPYAGDGDAGRTVGAGGQGGGEGSSSGGDIDTDLVGVAGGAGLAQSAADPNRPAGPEDSDGSSREFASGGPAKNEKGPNAGKIVGTTVQREGDIESEAFGRGASAVSRPDRADPDRVDDSFVGEISEGEASGDDSR